MKKTICSIVLAAALLIPNGCGQYYKGKHYIPDWENLKKIENQKYDKKTNNCFNKAIKYHKVLQYQGYESRVVIGHVLPDKRRGNHAWVEAYCADTETWHAIDPTWNQLFQVDDDGWNIELLSHRRVQGVCDTDITHKSQGIKKCHDVNRQYAH